MEEYLNTPIKEVVAKFPGVGSVLEEYNIGCVSCNVGSCLLKDIVEIHNLSDEDEGKLLTKIAGVIYPDRKVKIPKLERKKKTKPGEIKYSPPIKRLVDEHFLIKRLVALIPRIIVSLDVETKEGRQVVKKVTDFIRFYADKYHHAKEEEILFKYFDENLDILKVMRQDHEKARAHVRAILETLDRKDKQAISTRLNAYYELLNEHIKKEDEILYPWIDRNLSTSQVGEVFSKFNEVENKSDREVIEGLKKFVETLEDEYKDFKNAEGIK